MNVSKLSLVPLQRASLCLDCEIITAAHTHCLACGSAALLNLARTLNGEGASPMARGLAEVVSISARLRFESQRSPSAGTHRHHRFPGEGMRFPQMSGEPGRERTRSHRGDLLRELAAVFYRTMPLHLIGILVLAAAVA
jgi:hypothetical protein